MTQVKLAAEPRTEFGKGFSRRLRAAGRVPAVIYGAGTDTITLFETIRRDGRTISETKTIDNNVLGKNIDEVEKAVKELAETLKKTSQTRF